MSGANFEKENLSIESLQALTCDKLQKYLKDRGIGYGNKKKEDLVELCYQAHYLNIEKKDDEDPGLASKKRRSVKGITFPDPFDPICPLQWSDNLSTLPSVDFFDTTTFLLSYCGWTKDRLKRRKLDNSYQLHCSGHIHSVQISQLDPELFYVRARCVPETRQSAESYKLWTLIEKTGLIHSAECSCVAGDGSCKHVVSLLYGLNEMVSHREDRSEIGVTDTAAYWTKPKRVCRPLEVENLDIRRDTSTPQRKKPSAASGYNPLKDINDKQLEKDIKRLLRNTKTNAVALYTLSDSEDDCSSDELDIQNYPLNIIDLVSRYGIEQVDQFVNKSYIDSVSELTKGQSDNDMWHYQRKGRLTASNFYSAIHYKGDNPDNYIVKSVLGKYQFTSEATQYGRMFEPVARTQYENEMKQSHASFHCTETGVFVYDKFPFIAASPDGIVNCKCCLQGLVEIKCPFKMKNEMPQDAMSKIPSCIFTNGKYHLKRDLSSPYYVQILGQMAILNVSFCDFVMYTQKGIHIERVPFSQNLWDEMFSKIRVFYKQFILPALHQS